MLSGHLDSIYESAARVGSQDFVPAGSDAANNAERDTDNLVRDASEAEVLLLEAEGDPSTLAEAVLDDEGERGSPVDEISRLLGSAARLNELCDAPHMADRISVFRERRDEAQRTLDEKCKELSQLEAESIAMANAEQQLILEQKQLEEDLEAEQQEVRHLKALLAGKLQDVNLLMKELDQLKDDMDGTEAELMNEAYGNEAEEHVSKDLLREIEELENTLADASRKLQESENQLTAAKEEMRTVQEEEDDAAVLVDPDSKTAVHPNSLFMDVVRQCRKAQPQTASGVLELPEADEFSEVESDILETLEQAIWEIRRCCDLESAAERKRTLGLQLVEAVANAPAEIQPTQPAIEIKPSSRTLARGLLELARNGPVPIPDMKRILSPDEDDREGTRLLYILVANGLVTLDRFAGESGLAHLA